MNIYELTLIPSYGRRVMVRLCSDDISEIKLDDAELYEDYVYSNRTYHAELHGIEEEIDRFEFFINDLEIEQKINQEGNIQFTDTEYPEGRVFRDNIGFVRIAVRITLRGQAPFVLYSKYISVLVENRLVNMAVERMAEYVYRYWEKFLLSGPLLSEHRRSIRSDAPKGLDAQIQVLQDIVSAYSETMGYFNVNPKSRLQPMGHIDHYEKVKTVSSQTLKYIAQHPEYLMPSSLSTGIRKNKKYYLPSKTLIEENVIDCDIYENQIIVGFLKSLYQSVQTLKAEINNRLTRFPGKEEVEKGYFLSAAFAFATTKRRLEKNLEQVSTLCESVGELYVQYHRILPVSEQTVSQIPTPTAILSTIRPYRMIYEQIVRWFQFGMYDFRFEDFVLPMLQSNKLYEFYVLLKLYRHIETKGYQIQRVYANNYSKKMGFRPHNIAFKGSQCENTFVFWNDAKATEITLYYEPTVHSGKDKNVGENEVMLFRNISLSYLSCQKAEKSTKKEKTGTTYSPDYIIKIKRADHSTYIILDAKFSIIYNINLRELLYKYVLSLSTLNAEDRILGLAIVNGKAQEKENPVLPHEIYDLSPGGHRIYPFAKILTLTENHEDTEYTEQRQMKLLDELFELANV